ncbi:MAG: hypothetical protein MJ161_06540 [Clostridia bacterium]|nr:hypothetical protein [Clostridia bacterium]
MENLQLAIVSEDAAYNKALSVSIATSCRDISVHTFSSKAFVKAWSEYEGRGAYYDQFDVILWAGDEISESYGDNIVYLADRASLTNRDYANNRFCIYRYSTAHTIIAAIFDIYSHLTGRNAFYMKKNNTRLIGFASSRGGSGCTTVTMAVGQELCRFHGKKVLYLTLEDVESTECFAARGTVAKNVGEFLYRLLGREGISPGCEPGKIPFLDGYVVRSVFGIEAFAPTRGKNPLRELKADDMQKFLATLMDCGRYDVIVMDLSSCLTEAGIAAMRLADRICFTAKAGDLRYREENYMSQVICCGGEETVEKMIKVENMYVLPEGKKMSDLTAESGRTGDMISTGAYLRRFTRNYRVSGEDVMLEGGFGEDISRLTALMI